jgi:hypothetical protein
MTTLGSRRRMVLDTIRCAMDEQLALHCTPASHRGAAPRATAAPEEHTEEIPRGSSSTMAGDCSDREGTSRSVTRGPLSLRKSLPHALAKPVSDHTPCDLYEVSGANTLANTITYKR